MTNKNYMNELNDIKKMVGKVKSLKESIQFESFDPDELDDIEMTDEQPMGKMSNSPEILNDEPQNGEEMSAEDRGMAELDKMGAIDQIREITLKGMIKLCDNPEHPEYQALLKIFNMCNKAVTDKQNDDIQQK